MQQCALRARLRAARVSHLGRSHDIRNAFASPHQLGTIGDSSKHLSPLAKPFVRQRVLEATTSMPTPSGFARYCTARGPSRGTLSLASFFLRRTSHRLHPGSNALLTPVLSPSARSLGERSTHR